MTELQTFERHAADTLTRIVRVLDEVDPDRVEAIPSDGVVKLDFQGRRTDWVVNSQRGALQIWLAAERRAWHFALTGEGSDPLWVAPKTGEELFGTLASLLKEHEGLEIEF